MTLCPLQCGSASPQPEKPQTALRPTAVQSCAPDCQPSRNASCVQHCGCDCRTSCTALSRLRCHLIWITGNFRATVIAMSAGDLPGDNSLLQLFSLPWIRRERLRPADQPHKQDSHQGQACSTFWQSPVWPLGAHLHGIDHEKFKKKRKKKENKLHYISDNP